MQKDILEKNPAANVRVYVIWFSMLFSDSRQRWRFTGHMITDPRVLHFWDEQKLIGRWYAKQDGPEAGEGYIVWDAYYLYGPEAQWTVKPEPLISHGATVVDQFDKLRQHVLPLLGAKQ